MNAKANNEALTLEQQIQALMQLQARRDAILPLVAEEVAAIRELDKAAMDSKNAADQGNGQKGSIWDNVRGIVMKVYDATMDAPDTRHQVFSDVLDEFLNPKGGAGTDKVKLTTAGQYASTGRKMLVTLLTEQGRDPEDFREAGVKDVRHAFKDVNVVARNEELAELGKKLRYAAKHGTEKEYAALELVKEAITALYNPIRSRKDKASKKSQAAVAVPELQQQAPAEPAQHEVTAGDAADVAEQLANDAAELAALDDNNEVLKKQAV